MRPTNPPIEHENEGNELDPDEIENQNQANDNQIPDQRQNLQQPAEKTNHQNIQQKPKETNIDQPRKNPEIRDNKPSCQDCQRNNCIQFKESDIERVVSSARGNGTLYYKIKFKTGKSEWHFPCKIPNVLIRQFHADRTMSGKKRKRPLQKKQHKFFEKKDTSEEKETSTVNALTNNSEVDNRISIEESITERLLGVRMIKNKAYFLVQTGPHHKRWHTMASMNLHAREFIRFCRGYYDNRQLEDKIKRIREQHKPKTVKHEYKYFSTCDAIHEARILEDDSVEFLVGYMNPHIPPEWMCLDIVPDACLCFFILDLYKQFKKEMEWI